MTLYRRFALINTEKSCQFHGGVRGIERGNMLATTEFLDENRRANFEHEESLIKGNGKKPGGTPLHLTRVSQRTTPVIIYVPPSVLAETVSELGDQEARFEAPVDEEAIELAEAEREAQRKMAKLATEFLSPDEKAIIKGLFRKGKADEFQIMLKLRMTPEEFEEVFTSAKLNLREMVVGTPEEEMIEEAS